MRSLRVSQSGCNHSFAEIVYELCQLNWWPFAFSVSYYRILYLRKSHFHMYSSDAIYLKDSVYYLSIPQFCKLRSFYVHSCSHENCLLPSSFLSISLSVCLCDRTLSVQLPLDRFMWHFTLGTSWKSVKNFKIWLKSGKNIRPSTWRPMYVCPILPCIIKSYKSTLFEWSAIWLLG
jgi:hypothetical protein